MSTESLLDALRGTTRAQHDEIESVLRLMEPIPLPRYTAIISGFHAFLADWEPRIEAALPPHLRDWWGVRRRSAFAEADLHHLQAAGGGHGHGHATTAHTTAQAVVAQLPLHHLPPAFGSMYVIEGAALGGQVITPTLAHTLGLLPGRGASYFHGFGSDTGRMWRDFRQVISREVGASESAVRQACEAARATFEALTTVFRALPA